MEFENVCVMAESSPPETPSPSFAPIMTETPAADRPRERLLKLGAPNLRTAELLAILIRCGRRGESALQAGEKLGNSCRPS
jgi:hypothetical protein